MVGRQNFLGTTRAPGQIRLLIVRRLLQLTMTASASTAVDPNPIVKLFRPQNYYYAAGQL